MPPGMEWPRWRGRSLAFIASIELSGQQVPTGFPTEGSILFFYEATLEAAGFPGDEGGAVVRYLPPGTVTELRSWPDDLPDERRFREVRLRMKPAMTLPPYHILVSELLGPGGDHVEAYWELNSILEPEDGPRGLLGGLPDQIQESDMRINCALATSQVAPAGEEVVFLGEDARKLERAASEWRLLLQVPSLGECGMEWGGGGAIYYWIRAVDLDRRDFDRSWMVLQCG